MRRTGIEEVLLQPHRRHGAAEQIAIGGGDVDTCNGNTQPSAIPRETSYTTRTAVERQPVQQRPANARQPGRDTGCRSRQDDQQQTAAVGRNAGDHHDDHECGGVSGRRVSADAMPAPLVPTGILGGGRTACAVDSTRTARRRGWPAALATTAPIGSRTTAAATSS